MQLQRERTSEGTGGRRQQGNWCSRLMMAGNGSLRYGCHSRSINPPPFPFHRMSPCLTPLAGSRPATVPHSSSLSRSSPPFLTVCPLKTLLIAFWPHWPRRWRRWRWRRQRIADSRERTAGSGQADRGQRAACYMLLATGQGQQLWHQHRQRHWQRLPKMSFAELPLPSALHYDTL